MKKVKLKGTHYHIPTSWDEVTIQKQIEVEKLAREHSDIKPMAVVAGYSGVDIDEVKRLHLNDVKSLLSALEFTNTRPVEPVHQFHHKGKEYFIVESLLKAEFQDFISLEAIKDNYKDKKAEALPYIIAIIAKREGESLDSFDINERAKEFYDLPMSVAFGLEVFFCAVAMMSTVDSQKALQIQSQNLLQSIKSMRSIVKKHSGGGISILWQKAILLNYLKSLERKWKQYYTGFTSEAKKPSWTERFKRFMRKKCKIS